MGLLNMIFYCGVNMVQDVQVSSIIAQGFLIQDKLFTKTFLLCRAFYKKKNKKTFTYKKIDGASIRIGLRYPHPNDSKHYCRRQKKRTKWKKNNFGIQVGHLGIEFIPPLLHPRAPGLRTQEARRIPPGECSPPIPEMRLVLFFLRRHPVFARAKGPVNAVDCPPRPVGRAPVTPPPFSRWEKP